MPLEFTYGGEAEADDGKADVVDAKGPGSFAAQLFLDKKTPPAADARLSRRGAADDDADAARRRPAAGRAACRRDELPPRADRRHPAVPRRLQERSTACMLPHHFSRSIDGKPNEEMTFKTIRINPAFKPDAFAAK